MPCRFAFLPLCVHRSMACLLLQLCFLFMVLGGLSTLRRDAEVTQHGLERRLELARCEHRATTRDQCTVERIIHRDAGRETLGVEVERDLVDRQASFGRGRDLQLMIVAAPPA